MAAVHIARTRVYQDKRLNRRAYIGDFPEPIRYGVNTRVKAFYKMEPRNCRARSIIWWARPPALEPGDARRESRAAHP